MTVADATAATGKVNTQAPNTGNAVRHRVLPPTIPIPSNAPTDTCVVETGSP
jgi:hypothetical protein